MWGSEKYRRRGKEGGLFSYIIERGGRGRKASPPLYACPPHVSTCHGRCLCSLDIERHELIKEK
jgi:hypothetical protein